MSGLGITCPVCGSDTFSMETRKNPGSLRRRRQCRRADCDGRVTTVEMVAPKVGKLATTTNLVAMPLIDAEDLVVVPRRLLTVMREVIAGIDGEAGLMARRD